MSREIFAKVSATLDSNRKIRKAGRDGRDVFLWVLRQVALRDSDGSIPIEDVTDFEYLADQLMCSAEEAERGYRAAIKAGLIEEVTAVTGSVTDSCAIVGWDDEWSRRPMGNAERQARHKAKLRALKAKSEPQRESVTDASLPVTGQVTSNAVEESRVEESRSVSREPEPTAPRPANGNTDRFALEPEKPSKVRRGQRVPMPVDFRPDATVVAEARAGGVDLDREIAKLRDWSTSKGEYRVDWQATARNWMRTAAERSGHGPRPGAVAPKRKFL